MMKRINYLPLYILGFSFWSILLLMRINEALSDEKISQISAQTEFFLHIFMLAIAFKIFVSTDRERKIFFWLMLSNLGLFLNDSSFYSIIYFSKNYNFSFSLINYLINITFLTIWNISILVFLINLIKDVFTPQTFIKLFSILMLINFMIIFLFFDTVPPIFDYLSWQNISQLIGSLMELIIYNLSILCLIYSNKRGLSFITTGFIILISGDFLFTYSFLTQTHFIATYGELFWFLGILCIFFGMLDLKNQKTCTIWLHSPNHIKGKLAFWAFGISIINILPFFVLAYLFSPLNKTIFLILPSFLMLTSVAIVIVSLFTAKHFEIPFKKIVSNIESLMLNNDKSKFNNHFIIDEFIFLQEFILKVFDIKKEKEEAKKTLVSLTAQVAHDIRSPLMALNICLNNLSQLPEKQRILMRNVSNRINDIANNLLHQYVEKKEDPVALPLHLQTWLLAPLLESIVSEKRLQFEGLPIELEESITNEGFSAFAPFDLSRMKRLLSNLINNASEAFSTTGGKITLSLDAHEEKIVLKIIDNGCGIETALLDKVVLGTSFKDTGCGLGLPDAKKNIEAFGGTLQLHSTLNKGTTVELTLPRSNPPNWFVSEIFVSPHIRIGILDDDQSVHDAWDQRLLALSKNLMIHHFSTVSTFSDWYTLQYQPVQIFSDYELLGEAETGLDVLENKPLSHAAILVTSHYENSEVIARCQKIGVRLLPKNLLTHIPIQITDESVA